MRFSQTNLVCGPFRNFYSRSFAIPIRRWFRREISRILPFTRKSAVTACDFTGCAIPPDVVASRFIAHGKGTAEWLHIV
jgi:hypothetical protein